MLKKEEKKKVGRPKLADDELKKKSIKTIALSLAILMLFLVGGTCSLFVSNNSFGKLKGALKSTSSNCTIYVGNIETTSADIYWACKNSKVNAQSLTVYNSNSSGNVGSKIQSHNLKDYSGGSGWSQKKLSGGKYYVASIKLSNNEVINKLFKTPTRDYLKGDSKPSNITRVSNIGTTTATVEWFRYGSKVNSFSLYRKDGSSWKNVQKIELNSKTNGINYNQYGTYKLSSLSVNTQYKVEFSDGKYVTFTTTKKTTTKKTTINKNKYFTVKFNANGGKGTMSDQLVMHGNYNNNAGTKLNANKFTKSGYTFIGWYAKRSADGYWYSSNKKWEANPSSKALYKDQATVSRTVAPKAYVTMYAQWKKNSSNNTNKSNKVSITLNDKKGRTKNSKNTVYVSSTGTYYVKATITQNGTKKLYYRWNTFNGLNAKTHRYADPKNTCNSFSSKSVTINNLESLEFTKKSNPRSGRLSVYSSKSACTNDTKNSGKNAIATAVINYDITNSTTSKTSASSTNEKSDLYVLSHIINAEVGDQGDACQRAVGSVILNRVKSKDFPNTIYDVVFAKGQYEPTWSGTYYNEPSQQAINNAKYLLQNGSTLDSGVIYQSLSKIGNNPFKISNCSEWFGY